MSEEIPAESGFAGLGLRDEVLRAIADSGYTQPTPIQAQAVPSVLAGHDLIGIAQTGTGKTAAFVLPMIDRLAAGRARARMPRSVILSPTRELAAQTAENFERYGKYLKLSMALVIGGVSMGDQEKLLDRGVDVLIATPGRLLDWFERGKVLLGGVGTLVVDEADRMLDMGFIPDVERIAGLLTRRQQTLLFSATMPKEVRRLAETFLKDPVEVTVAPPATTSANVQAYLCTVDGSKKSDAVKRLIEDQNIEKAIIFCNRKRDVSSLNRRLVRHGYNARDIHGDLDQSQRIATLDAFKADQVDFLVATDVAARGLDISDMPNVINYDVPTNPDDYVHRIGRTGRAGKLGRAFTLATPEDEKFVSGITRLIGTAIDHLELVAGQAKRSVVVDEDAEEPKTPSRRRRRAATAEGESASPKTKRRSRRDKGSDEPDEQVVGLGAHVPQFLARPVPIKGAATTPAEA
ncbi:MAG: DEAD/DEAH box helicase [Geminicoccaceae bacterium]